MQADGSVRLLVELLSLGIRLGPGYLRTSSTNAAATRALDPYFLAGASTS